MSIKFHSWGFILWAWDVKWGAGRGGGKMLHVEYVIPLGGDWAHAPPREKFRCY